MMDISSKPVLERLYVYEKKSAAEIAKLSACSERKVVYWLAKHRIPKRSIAEAIYQKYNPAGDPFLVRSLSTNSTAFLYGLGIGLYWGEGTKSNRHSVRLGNTDPKLIKKFLEFLKAVYSIEPERLRFGLQVFSDMSPRSARTFWAKELGVSSAQFQKVVVTSARSIGTYRQKTRHGVLTVYYNNKKLRDVLCGVIDNM